MSSHCKTATAPTTSSLGETVTNPTRPLHPTVCVHCKAPIADIFLVWKHRCALSAADE